MIALIEYNKLVKYNVLCEMFGEKPKRGGYLKRQLNCFKKNYEIEKVDRKYRIIRKLTNEEILENNFFAYRNKERYKGFKIPVENSRRAGVYKIQLNNVIYIGQTNNLVHRFSQHLIDDTNNHGTAKLLRQGAIFDVVCYEDDNNERLKIEQETIKYYYFSDDYICINYVGTDEQVKNIKKYLKLKFDIKDKNKIISLLKDNDIFFEEI